MHAIGSHSSEGAHHCCILKMPLILNNPRFSMTGIIDVMAKRAETFQQTITDSQTDKHTACRAFSDLPKNMHLSCTPASCLIISSSCLYFHHALPEQILTCRACQNTLWRKICTSCLEVRLETFAPPHGPSEFMSSSRLACTGSAVRSSAGRSLPRCTEVAV